MNRGAEEGAAEACGAPEAADLPNMGMYPKRQTTREMPRVTKAGGTKPTPVTVTRVPPLTGPERGKTETMRGVSA